MFELPRRLKPEVFLDAASVEVLTEDSAQSLARLFYVEHSTWNVIRRTKRLKVFYPALATNKNQISTSIVQDLFESVSNAGTNGQAQYFTPSEWGKILAIALPDVSADPHGI